MKRRRNPSSSSMIPLLLAGAGVGLVLLSRRSAPVAGLGDLGFSIGKSLKKAAKKATSTVSHTVKAVTDPVRKVGLKDAAVFAAGGGIVQAAKMGLDAGKHLPGGVKALVTGGVTAVALRPLVQKVQKGKRAPAKKAAPGQSIIYQDENGNTITQAEYERRQALYEQQSACQAKGWLWNGATCAPAQVSDPSAPTPTGGRWNDSGAQAPASSSGGSSGGGGGGESDYYGSSQGSEQSVMPSTESTPEPTSVDDAAPPAPAGKMSPLIAVGAFAAVPILFGLMGDH